MLSYPIGAWTASPGLAPVEGLQLLPFITAASSREKRLRMQLRVCAGEKSEAVSNDEAHSRQDAPAARAPVERSQEALSTSTSEPCRHTKPSIIPQSPRAPSSIASIPSPPSCFLIASARARAEGSAAVCVAPGLPSHPRQPRSASQLDLKGNPCRTLQDGAQRRYGEVCYAPFAT